jgi:MFS family permease
MGEKSKGSTLVDQVLLCPLAKVIERTIQIGAVISIIGVMLQAASVRLEMILAGRSITGFAVGVMSVGVPVYLAECASRTLDYSTM